ncbi:MAG: ATP-binding protein [Oscillospiraceae bacterium]|jgi:nitrogen fixation/metabolism regulation signal transduction histidine kinase|nr:ATP-binding protein [Oscillospiraceae bacterium]
MRELSLNILDIVQNSISAGSPIITIKVHESTPKKSMLIEILDEGRGMSAEQVLSVTDPFFTTRTTRKVGMGVPLFKMAAEMTGGSFNINSQLGSGTGVKAEFYSEHIDMTPLGDINQTVAMLIRMNPNIDFVFERSLDEQSFTLDTRELRQILEGVPLDTPDVMAWITEFLEENDKELIGGA